MNDIEQRKSRILAARIRIHILEMCRHFGAGHVGGSMSIADALAVLYSKHMDVDPQNPGRLDRDVLVLSKGHAGPALYAALAEKGFFDPEMLLTLNQGGTRLPSHPDRLKTPGVDMTTGSLGQGTSSAAGMALAQKKLGLNHQVYLFVGDGELNEGQCWEAFQFITARNLHNCVVLIDENKKQLDGYTQDVLHPFCLEDKLAAFGFAACRVDGQDHAAIDLAIEQAKKRTDRPSAIVLDTIKGQGVAFFESMMNNHSIRFGNKENREAAEQAIRGLHAFIDQEERLCSCL